jgi:hypothetical protein
MSLGGDRFIHAPHTGDVVKVSSLNESYYAHEFTGGRRMDPAVASEDESSPTHGAADGDDRPGSHRSPPRAHSARVREANRALERDAAQARQPGTRTFKALEQQERGKGQPPHPSEPQPSKTGGGGDVADSAPLDPQAESAAQHIAHYHYGFIRESSSTPDYELLKAAGYNGILFHAEDAHLGEAMAAARAAGIQSVGIWAPANMEDPATFAQRLADLEQYKPDIVVPDVEVEGKGYQGSPQWQWSEDFVSLYRKLVPNQRWAAVTPMGNQDDFDYAAYTSRGASVWPQTYGATDDVKFDPQAMIDVVVRNGVDPRLVNPIVAPGQSAEGLRNFASYLDDFQGTFPQFDR